jgi:hypothetical protein
MTGAKARGNFVDADPRMMDAHKTDKPVKRPAANSVCPHSEDGNTGRSKDELSWTKNYPPGGR